MKAEEKIDRGGLSVNCRKATYYFSTSFERPLTFREKLLMNFHLLFCSYCRLFKKQWSLLQKSFGDTNGGVTETKSLPPEWKSELKEKISNGLN